MKQSWSKAAEVARSEEPRGAHSTDSSFHIVPIDVNASTVFPAAGGGEGAALTENESKVGGGGGGGGGAPAEELNADRTMGLSERIPKKKNKSKVKSALPKFSRLWSHIEACISDEVRAAAGACTAGAARI